MSSTGTPTGSGSNLGLIGAGSSGYTRTALNVEEQNDERLDGLLGKVKILKDVSCVARTTSIGRDAAIIFFGELCLWRAKSNCGN